MRTSFASIDTTTGCAALRHPAVRGWLSHEWRTVFRDLSLVRGREEGIMTLTCHFL